MTRSLEAGTAEKCSHSHPAGVCVFCLGCPVVRDTPGRNPLRFLYPAPDHLIRNTLCFCVREADSCLQQRFHGGAAETRSVL